MKTLPSLAITLSLALLGSGCVMSIDKDYKIGDGETRNKDFYTVDGNIDVGVNTKIGAAKTVDGDITISEGCITRTLATVDGNIKLAASVLVDGSLNTVDGNVTVAEHCEITGSIRTIDGKIEIKGSSIKGDVRIASGEILLNGSQVEGSIIVKKTPRSSESRALIDIGPDSVVDSIIVKASSEKVSLRIHNNATVGSIKGVQAEYYGEAE